MIGGGGDGGSLECNRGGIADDSRGNSTAAIMAESSCSGRIGVGIAGAVAGNLIIINHTAVIGVCHEMIIAAGGVPVASSSTW